MVEIHNKNISLLENEILWMYREHPDLLSGDKFEITERRDLINDIVLANQQDFLLDIIAFNDVLRDALKEMYDRAHRIWNDIKDKDTWGESVELTAKCFLDNIYPQLHPIQGEDRQELWEAISDSGYNPLYEDGVSFPLVLPCDIHESFESFIGMVFSPLNWNEGLDQELSKDLHLIRQFHHLFDHMSFAITDFIYVRNFKTEIQIEIQK